MMLNRFDLLAALEEVSVGIILIDGADIVYSNKRARELFAEFNAIEQNPLEFFYELIKEDTNKTDFGKQVKSDVKLIDNNKKERYITIEINQKSEPASILVIDVTQQNALSVTDELTGLGNRKKYEQIIRKLESEAVFPVSIVEGDLNSLKLANDLFGHAVGDELIIAASQILLKCIRLGEDELCRWGGDEFVIILPGVTDEAAKDVCERIETRFSVSDFRPIPPSMSLGFATTQHKGEPLKNVLERAEARMYRDKLIKASQNRIETLNVLRAKLNDYSCETLIHSERLKKIMISFGKYLNMNSDEIEILGNLAYYHDIGMSALQKELLTKKAAFTSEERRAMEMHVQSGYAAIKAIPEFTNLSVSILHHHESWDGSGYPLGLKGEEINYLARILRIGDNYEVMTSHRDYRDSKTEQEALDDLKANRGAIYDPELVDRFITMVVSATEKDW